MQRDIALLMATTVVILMFATGLLGLEDLDSETQNSQRLTSSAYWLGWDREDDLGMPVQYQPLRNICYTPRGKCQVRMAPIGSPCYCTFRGSDRPVWGRIGK